MRRWRLAPAGAMMLLASAGCAPAGDASQRQMEETGTPAPAPAAITARMTSASAQSRLLGKSDFTLRGKPACKIAYAYAGHAPDTLFWEEPCADVTARLAGKSDLQGWGKWRRLDDHARKFVQAMPDGRVLYVEGRFSASVYPVGTSGEAYEVTVAD
ncbi:hypothetical protein [uncultured Sphingobium sp.]|uniref:hypothetical protein n=1 Tax=uncultured Sphingobium sp. TaxID=316087 RepID=UPI00261E3C29|nr:hypothetical protein [uncultured Sphingobium sp.]